jgi:hypothetical protein
MTEPTPFAFAQLFSELIGRKVGFSQTTVPVETKNKQIYGIYRVVPPETAIVVQADLKLLGSLAGVLVGLPDATVKERLKIAPIDELLRDAIHELLNIASTVVTTKGRAIFSKMVTDPVYIDGSAGTVFKKPDHKSYFSVTVDGYEGGAFYVFSQFYPVQTVSF